MAKRILLTLLQFVLFAALLLIGGFWPLLRLYALGSGSKLLVWVNAIPAWRWTLSPTHYVNIDGYVFAALLLLLILAFEALRRRFHPWMALTGLAFMLALLLSIVGKFGSVTVGF